MRFCPVDGKVLTREEGDGGGAIMFRCDVCTRKVKGDVSDVLLFEYVQEGETDLYEERRISTAAYDRTVQHVPIPCKKCGVPYLSQLILGASARVELVCDCGARYTGAEVSGY